MCERTFTLVTTKSSVIVNHGDLSYSFTASVLSNADLWMFRAVRDRARVVLPGRPMVRADEPEYWRLNRQARPDAFGEGFTEVDVNAAYWHLARRADLLTDKVYSRGLALPPERKTARLAVLGALARRRHTWAYDPRQGWRHLETDHDPVLASGFYAVARELGALMSSALDACGTSGVCFWVDNLVCRTEVAHVVEARLAAEGLPCTRRRLAACTFADGSREVRLRWRERERDDARGCGVGFKHFRFPVYSRAQLLYDTEDPGRRQRVGADEAGRRAMLGTQSSDEDARATAARLAGAIARTAGL